MAKATTTKFADIKTVEQLRTRIKLTDKGTALLSTGNQYMNVRKFMTEERVSNDQIQTGVEYTAGSGNHMTIRFI